MRRSVVVLAPALLILAACNRQTPDEPAIASASAPAPIASTAAAAAPAMPAVKSATGPNFDGFGPARFGMNAQETRQAWGSALSGNAPANIGGCYLLTPASAKSPRDLSVMLEGDKFVRYDIGTADQVAPGGGKVGMSANQVRALYPGRIREQPDKYLPGGTNLRVSANDGSGSALVFQTDAGDKVVGWRVGQPPAVDYTEGCS